MNRYVRRSITTVKQTIQKCFTSAKHYVEINRLLIKAGRRCAYDLTHACDVLENQEFSNRIELNSKWYRNRANMWLNIFDAGDDGKNYRDQLHREIWELNCKIDRYKKHCEAHGIPHLESDDPF